MIRNLKALGLALVAVCAIGVLGASAAVAATFTTTSGATLTGSELSQTKFTATGQTLTCSSVLLHGTAPAASFESVEISPRYTECKSALGTTATFTGFGHLASEAGTPGCKWVFFTSGTGRLVCENGHEVTTDFGPCVVHIPEQHFSSGLTVVNTSIPPRKVHIKTVPSITGTFTDGFLCPFSGSGHGTNIVIEGEVEMVAEVGGEQVDLSFDP